MASWKSIHGLNPGIEKRLGQQVSNTHPEDIHGELTFRKWEKKTKRVSAHGSIVTTIMKKLNASPDDMIAYMTSQDFPYSSVPVKLKTGWHIFEIDLSIKEGKYYATWYIDKEKTHGIQLGFGNEISFYIFCSVENLKFIGDQIPQQENYGLFDFVKYKYHR